MTATATATKRQSNLTIARWVAAAIILIIILVVSIASASATRFQVCENVVAQVGSDAVAESCRPLSLTDPSILLAVLLVVLLVLPDFSKISIAGFLDLERKVESQAERTRELERTLHLVQSNMQIASLQQHTTVNVGPDYLGPDEAVERALPDLDRKERRFEHDA